MNGDPNKSPNFCWKYAGQKPEITLSVSEARGDNDVAHFCWVWINSICVNLFFFIAIDSLFYDKVFTASFWCTQNKNL